MTGRHDGKADDLFAIIGTLLAFLVSLALIIYVLIGAVRRPILWIIADLMFVCCVTFIIGLAGWRRGDRNFPWVPALLLAQAIFQFVNAAAPSFHWIYLPMLAIVGVAGVFLIRDGLRWLRQRRQARAAVCRATAVR
jgi:hypothetical protein